MPTFQKMGKPDENLLETFFRPTAPKGTKVPKAKAPKTGKSK